MARYVFTVPALFDVEPHPLGIGPDDLFLLDVECFDVGAGETLARIKANELFGPLAWCSVYPADHPALPGLIARYYPGRIVDIDGQEVELFDTPTPTTPDLLTALEASDR